MDSQATISASTVVNFGDLAKLEERGLVSKPHGKAIAAPKVAPNEFPVPDAVIAESKLRKSEVHTMTASGPSPAPSSSFQAINDDGTRVPPDTDAAVGPWHIVVAVNSEIRILTKTGTQLSRLSLASFWSTLASYDVFDPRVVYDALGRHFVMIAASDRSSPASSVFIGVSQSSDPTGTWYLYRVDADTSDSIWADYPNVGVNQNWIVISANMFSIAAPGTPAPFSRVRIFTFDKASLYSGQGISRVFTFDDNTTITAVPSVSYDNSSPDLYLLSNYSGNSSGQGFLRLDRITGPPDSPALVVAAAFPSSPEPWDGMPPGGADFAPQLGASQKIQAGDSRLSQVIYREGTLWCAHTVFLPAGGSPARSAVQWWQVGLDGTVRQRGLIDDPSAKYFYAFPSIAVNQAGDALIGYTRFSSSEYASANYAYRSASDAPGYTRGDTVLKPGEAPFSRALGGWKNRWGDYSATAVDPADDRGFWTIQEYAASPTGGQDRWGTWLGQVMPEDDCGSSNIDIGQAVAGSLGPPDCLSRFHASPSYAGRYSFDGSAGQKVAITVTSADFPPEVYLSNPDHTLLASGTPTGSGVTSIPESSGYISLPASGSYTIEVTTPAGQTGSYLLSLTECATAFTPAGQSFDASGGSGNIAIINSGECSWAAASDAAWLTITSAATGTGNNTLNYSVAANDTPGSRVGHLTISGRSFEVTQDSGQELPLPSALSPSSVLEGSSAFSLTVRGSGFSTNSVVLWNGLARPTTYISPGELSAEISSSDVSQAGSVQVAAASPASGNLTSNALTFHILYPAPLLTSITPSSVQAGAEALSVTFTGDHFQPSSTVQCNGWTRTTTYVSSTELRALISRADMDSAASLSLAVSNPAPGGGTSAALTLAVEPEPLAINWPAPDDLVYGTPLSAEQLNAAAASHSGPAAGTYSYDPPAGSILPAGIGQVLRVVFTPTDLLRYAQASASITISVRKASQQISFPPLCDKTVGDGPFALPVNASSGLPVTLSVTSNAMLSGAILTVTAAGTITITAYQQGNDNYEAAPPVSRTFAVLNPFPDASRAAPGTVPAGAPETSVLIEGSGFVTSSVVSWNGSVRQSSYLSPTQLSAGLTASDLAMAGRGSLVVFNPGPGGGTSRELLLPVTDSQITGVVKDSHGAPIGHAAVKAAQYGNVLFTTVSCDDGTFVLPVISGAYDIQASREDFFTGGKPAVSFTTPSQSPKLIIKLHRLSFFQGSVRTEAGVALQGATIGAYKGGTLSYSTVTDSQGSYRLPVLAGKYVLKAASDGFSGESTAKKAISEGQIISGADFTLKSP